MTEPSPARPLPGPPLPGPPRPGPTVRPPAPVPPGGPGEERAPAEQGAERFAELERLPVAEHVAVFEAEHSRLQRELATIDQL